MANRQAIKFFAVAALAAGTSTAVAGGAGARPAQRAPEPMVERVDMQGFVHLTIKTPAKPIKPRVLANYRPACGNTGGKSEGAANAALRNCTPEEIDIAKAQARSEAEASRKHYERVAVEHQKLMSTAEAIIRAEPALTARVLINGRPACGNTGGKGQRKPAFCELQAAR